MERSKKINKHRLNIWAGVLLFVLSVILEAIPAYSQKIWVQSPVTGTREDNLEVGSTLDLEVWVDMGTLIAKGITFYLTLDNRYLEVEDVKAREGFQPFDFGGGQFGDNDFDNTRRYVQNEGIPYIELDGAVISQNTTASGIFMIGKFRVRAINVISSTLISVDYSPASERDTKYHPPNQGSVGFGFAGNRLPMELHVFGIGVDGIPDIFMEPGDSNNDILLDDYVTGTSTPPDQFNWTYAGGVPQLTAEIDPVTHRVTFQSDAGYFGKEMFVFRVDYGQEFEGKDTMYVTVSQKPDIDDEYFDPPGQVIFYEDQSWEGYLNLMANDADHDSTLLQWSGTPLSENIFVNIDDEKRKLKLTAEQDWNGNTEMMLRVFDPFGFGDSLLVPVTVLSVNDPPRFHTKLPDVSFTPSGKDSSIILNDYIIDIDDSLSTIKWSVTGNTNIEIEYKSISTYQVILSSAVGFTGEEEVIFQAWDPSNEIVRDTIIVSVRLQPPEFFKPLPDTCLFSGDSLFHNYVDLSEYVSDADNTIEQLSYYTMGDSAIVVNIGEDGMASFDLSTYNFRLGQETITFYVQDPDGSTGSYSAVITVIPDEKPYFFNFPEIVYVPMGGVDSSIVLFDYLKDGNTRNEDITWSYSGNVRTALSINSTTGRVKISSPDPEFFGDEIIIFQAEDPEGNTGNVSLHVKIIPVDGTPIVTDIPNVNITQLASRTIDLDDYVTIFPFELKDKLQWTWTPETDAKVSVTYVEITHKVTFSVLDTDYRGVRPFTFTVTNVDSNKSASDDMTVTVAFGKAPILGVLPNVVFVTGSQDSSLQLSRYVIDKDNAVEDLTWSVSGNTNVTFEETALGQGGDHILRLGNLPGYVGEEILTVTCVDPEGNYASDDFSVNVISSTMIDIIIIPNPVDETFIDITVFATDTLDINPTIEVLFNDYRTNISSSKIPGIFAYKGDYRFPENAIGTAKIFITTRDHFGSVHNDTTQFVIGEVSSKKTTELTLDNIQLKIPENNSLDGRPVLLIPGSNFMIPERLKNSYVAESFIIGPEKLFFKNNAEASIKIPDDLAAASLNHMGIFRFENSELFPVITLSNKIERILKGNIKQSGSFYILHDSTAPEIEIKSVRFNNNNLELDLTVNDEHTGVDWTSFTVNFDSKIYNGKYSVEGNKYILKPVIPWESGFHSVEVSVSDYMKNSSSSSKTIEINAADLPRDFRLYQNYPNPFNPVTRITYQIPLKDHVELAIFSISGKKVIDLVSEIRNPGIHVVEWNGRNSTGVRVASGLYFYRLKSKNQVLSKRMVLLK